MAGLAGTRNPVTGRGYDSETFDAWGETVTPLMVTAMGEPISRTADGADGCVGGGGGGATVGCGGCLIDWCCLGAMVATRTAVIWRVNGSNRS